MTGQYLALILKSFTVGFVFTHIFNALGKHDYAKVVKACAWIVSAIILIYLVDHWAACIVEFDFSEAISNFISKCGNVVLEGIKGIFKFKK